MQHEASHYELSQWARDVKEADNWTCVLCGQKQDGSYWHRAEAHHIKPKSMFPDLALEITNGITLCRRCHNLAPHRPDALEYPPLREYLEQTLIFTVPKGQKALIEAAAKAAGESVNEYTQRALLARLGITEWPVRAEAPSTES